MAAKEKKKYDGNIFTFKKLFCIFEVFFSQIEFFLFIIIFTNWALNEDFKKQVPPTKNDSDSSVADDEMQKIRDYYGLDDESSADSEVATIFKL